MIMQEATPEMIEEWKSVWREYKDRLRPNRKTGTEIVTYLSRKYPLTSLSDDKKAMQIVSDNVLNNDIFFEKLTVGKKPDPIAFIVENEGQGKELYTKQDKIFAGSRIFVGVDKVSGYFCVEGSRLLWDELCAFQGLDEKDINNFFCVAQYMECLKKFSMLDEVLGQ